MARRVDWWRLGCLAFFAIGVPATWWAIVEGIMTLVKLIVR